MKYDVLVIGGGHAGIEAANAAARRGASVALVTLDQNVLGRMSCNPAWGGVGKGHLVFEVMAMGGLCGLAADQSGLHFRRLNTGRGPAVRGTRVQCDRKLYTTSITELVRHVTRIKVIEAEAVKLVIEQDVVKGIQLRDGVRINTNAVVLANGTFLGAKLHRGENTWEGGRLFEPSSDMLAESLREMGLEMRKLKTGTPPRLLAKGIDLSKWQMQTGDDPARGFTDTYNNREQIHCYKSTTNEKVHAALEEGFSESPLFSGRIEGVGPPYCPSIEDKVRRYKEREEHPIFLEPEGWQQKRWYLAGFSSSLPEVVQDKAVRMIPGLENCIIDQHAYAVEYWSVKRRELSQSMESRTIKGLFWAGQVCGTSGYEEAAALGLVAGVNAAAHANGFAAWEPEKETSYIGVMTRDLVECEQEDPYRMLTSRAENRLQLREYNARYRLADDAFRLGLIEEEEWERRKKEDECMENGSSEEKGFYIEEMEARLRYRGYQRREDTRRERMMELWDKSFAEMRWEEIDGLSNDGLDRINKTMPISLAAAAKNGVRYTDLLIIAAWIKNRNSRRKNNDE